MHISANYFVFGSLAASFADVGIASASDANMMLRAKVDLPEAEMRSLIASKAKSAEKLSALLQFLKDRHESNRFLQGDAVPELYEGDGDAPPGFGFDFGDVDLGDLAGSFDLCGKDNDLEFMGTTCSCSLRSAEKEYFGLMDIVGDFSHVMENGRKCIALLSTSHFRKSTCHIMLTYIVAFYFAFLCTYSCSVDVEFGCEMPTRCDTARKYLFLLYVLFIAKVIYRLTRIPHLSLATCTYLYVSFTPSSWQGRVQCRSGVVRNENRHKRLPQQLIRL